MNQFKSKYKPMRALKYFISVTAAGLMLIGCGENSLCAEHSELVSKTARGLHSAANGTATKSDIDEAQKDFEQLIKVKEKIRDKKITCKEG